MPLNKETKPNQTVLEKWSHTIPWDFEIETYKQFPSQMTRACFFFFKLAIYRISSFRRTIRKQKDI